MAKLKPQELSGSEKRKKKAKRIATDKRLRIAMDKYVIRTEDDGDSKELPAAKEIPSLVLEEEENNIIEVKSEGGDERESTLEESIYNNVKYLPSAPVPFSEEKIQNYNDFNSNFEDVTTTVPEEKDKDLYSNSKDVTFILEKEEIKKVELECRNQISISSQKNNFDYISNVREISLVLDEKEAKTDVDFTPEAVFPTNSLNYTDPSLWPPITDSFREYFNHTKLEQNIDCLASSKKIMGKIERTCSKNNFFRYKKNGEIVNREWLIYSPSAKAVFCYICKLYGGSNDQALCKEGFSDWRNIVKRLQSHENSDFHRKCMYSFSTRSKCSNRIDNSLVEQFENECEYWRKILLRVVAVIKYISQRGLACFGDNETFGSVHNGNFLGILELLSLFDSFLSEHIHSYGNKGKGKVNYLSSTVVTEFIDIMSNRVLKEIVLQIQEAKYFGIIVDSTPDISHIDQLAVVLRYVHKGEPVERFLKFIPIHSHGSQNLHDVIVNFLDSLKIELKYCRGQSFDNARNMSGIYSGLQARLKNDYPLIHYVPCSAHSLNLVGTSAAECCHSAVSFFGVVQSLYNFFSASTHRWELLAEKAFSDARSLTLKSISGTRWSANADAVKALKKNFMNILKVLDDISNSETETASTRHDAKSLYYKMSNFEFALMTVIWDGILQRMNKVSKSIQSEKCKMSAIVPLYNSLIKFVNHVRSNFDECENQAEALIGSRVYKKSRPKRVPKSRMLDETSSKDVEFSERENFLYRTHYVICDSLITELENRKLAYDNLESIFGFMCNKSISTVHIKEDAKKVQVNYSEDREEEFSDESTCNEKISDVNIKERATKFQEIYSEDIEEEFPDEFLQFNEFISKDMQPIEKLKLIKYLNIEQTFPNVEIALRIMLSIPISNCSSERSFSALKRIKNRMRSTLSESKLSGLSLLAIESDITEKIDFNDIVDEFAKRKSRKKPM